MSVSSTSGGRTGTPARTGTVARLGRVCVRHRRATLFGWVALLIGTLALSGVLGPRYANNFSLPGTESQRATDLLARVFPAQAGDSDQIVLSVAHGKLTDPAVRERVSTMLAKVAALPHVTTVVSPYGPGGRHAISAAGDVAFATVNFDERANVLPKPAIQRVIDVAQAAGGHGLQVALGGQAIEQAQRISIGTATLVGLLAAMLVLFITFGSFVAMGLPIITALLGLGTGIGLAGLASQILSLPDFATELAAMIGLGVGIDYALFILTRFRENHRGGMELNDAIDGAMDTAGRAVLFAGATVIVALLGQFALGVNFLYGLAIASSLAVLMTMLAALTVLPALLSRFGARIARERPARRRWRARRRQPARPSPATAVGASPGGAPRGFWVRWAALIERHPWQGAAAGLAIMLTLAAPALALRLGNSDAGNDPAGQTTRTAYDTLARGFGAGFNGPFAVVASLPHAGDSAALESVAAALRATPDVASVSPPRQSADGRTAVITVYPHSSPESLASTNLVTRLRSSVLPPVERSTGATLLVGGASAAAIDFTHVLSRKLPLFIALVVLISALLLFVVFRSLVIPVQAALMNLLSIGAALGVTVAVFQWGWLGGLIGVSAGPIEAFIPVMLFAIVFGLSMDYEVFLVSRIYEEWMRRRDPSVAVREGLASTGRVITAAATIMICVFLSFVLGDERVLKLFGLSLASAVFLDAFVVRSVLLPSVLTLLGRWTWWLPSGLAQRLPHVAIDQQPPLRGGEPLLEPGA